MPGLVLTERDHDLLLTLYRYRYLATSQVRRLLFPSLQTATRRIRTLAAAGYLTTFRVPDVPEQLLALGKPGAEAVAEALLVSLDDLSWTNGRQPTHALFMRHFLAITDFRIALTKAIDAREDVELLGFIPEFLAYKVPKEGIQKYIRDIVSDIQSPRGKLAHIPDGVFAIRRGDNAALFFLEIDRGTETLTNPQRGVLKILRFYLTYLTEGGYQRYQEEFDAPVPFQGFRLLFATSSAARLANVRTVGDRLRFEPAHAKRFLWLTTLDEISEETILAPLWLPLPVSDTKRLAIVSAHAQEAP